MLNKLENFIFCQIQLCGRTLSLKNLILKGVVEPFEPELVAEAGASAPWWRFFVNIFLYHTFDGALVY